MGRRRRRQSKNIGSLSYRGLLVYRRPLRLEPLEERRMMAVITVTTNSDVVDLADGVVSLREAVFVANTVPGADSIEFDFGHDGPETIVLTQGELAITDSLTITAPGANLLTIDASGSDPTPDENNGDGSRVFLIDDGVRDNRFTAEIRGMTLTGGDTSDRRGGAIHSREHLTVAECVISGNAVQALPTQSGGWGGGIQTLYGNLTVIDSTLAGNSATQSGGAIDFNEVSFDSLLTITNSTIMENAGGAEGGGILIAGDATITDTLIHDNSAGNGGGIAVWSNATDANVSIENSQITNNRATAGGGIYSTSNAATFLIVGSAITGNEAVSIGGGILMRRSGPLAANAYSLEVRSSTISGNLASGGVGLFATDPTDGTGTAIKIESSRIAENKLHVPSSDGPAGGIDTPRIARLVITDSVVEANDGVGIGARGVGQPFGVLTLERTQVRDNGRAGVRARDLSVTLTESTVAGNGDDGVVHNTGSLNVVGGSFSDNHGSGIYSHTGDVNITGATITGNTSSQSGGGIYSFQGKLTVATSIVSGNQSASGGGGIHHGSNGSHTLRITDSTISDNAGRRGGGVYSSQYVYVADSIISKNQATLQGGGIDALNRVVLLRSAVTDNLTIGPNRSGGGISALGAADLVLIQDSSVSNNSATGSGGGIQTNATVRVTRGSILGNTAFAHGGGIHAPGRTITVTDSTVARNRTTGPNAQGGGIVGGAVTITQSTVSGNRTEGSLSPGGGIVASQLTLNQSMVVDNHTLAADAMSGGIQVSGATQLNGSIIADNSAGGGNPDIRTGSFVTPNYSLVGNTTGLTAVQLNVLNAGVSNLLNSGPKLGPLAFNGGPTFADGSRMLTHALLAGSPAIDAGDPLASGPVAMYRFEESVGALVAADAVGDNDGAYHGNPALGSEGSPLVGGDGVNLDGVDDHVTAPATVADDFTLSLWVNTAQPALSGVRIGLVDADAVNAVSGFGLYIESGRFVFRTAGSAIIWSMPINNGNWHHLAVTRNTTTGARTLYVDGVLRDSAPSGPTGALADVTEWSIGRLLGGAGHFAGLMDELAVYNRALSTTEIAQLAAGGQPAFDQRGMPHLRVLDGDNAAGARIDIGAYEHQFGETYNFVVDTLVDESDGDYSAGDFSLREAIELANANSGKDSIEFDPALWVNGPQTIALSLVGNQSNDRSALFISDSLALHGPGAGLLTLDASGLDPTPELNNGDGGRVIEVSDSNGSDAMEVEISGLTIRGGDVGSDGSAYVDGGGIKVHLVQFALRDCVVTDNATQAAGGGVAIAVEQSPGSSIIERCTFVGNYAGTAAGGLLTNTSNFAPTIVRDSLFQDNVAVFAGGGIAASSNAFWNQPFVLENSTLSGNIAMQGGGLSLGYAAGAIVRSSTITNNTASTATGAGGVYSYWGEAILQNAIVAGNHASNGSSSDLDRRIDGVFGNDGSFDISYSLIGTNLNSGFDEAPVGSPDANGNLIGGTAHGVINPLLGPLAANGGPTKSHMLLRFSPAINAGDPMAVAGAGDVPEFDQRGEPHGRVLDDDNQGAARIDMGAYERAERETFVLVVDTLLDELDGDYGPGDLSLREAVEIANSNLGNHTIEFSPSLHGGTIRLGLDPVEYPDVPNELFLSPMALRGPGADLLAIDAQGNSRIFNINHVSGAYEISGLTLTGGETDGNGVLAGGGAIRSATHDLLTLTDMRLVGNRTLGDRARGGAVWANGPLVLQRSEVSGNSTEGFLARGGAIAASGDGVTVSESWIHHNHTTGYAASGGGIHAYGSSTIVDSTISGNRTEGEQAGGAGFDGYGVTLQGVTLSGNKTSGARAHGAGVFSSGEVQIAHSTITGNVAIAPDASGGGFFTEHPANVSHSIVAGNSAGAGSPDLFVSGQLVVSFSLIGDGAGGSLAEAPVGTPDANGNLIGGTVNGLVDPQLSPLSRNGGPTMTHALLPDSPAINAGDAEAVAGMGGVPEFDQRGLPWSRVVGGRIDIGAVEWQSNPLPGDYNFNGKVDAADYSVWRDTRGSVNDLRADGTSAASPGVPDGIVDALDYAFWKANFGNKLVVGIGAGGGSAGTAESELRLAGGVVNGAIEIEDTDAETANDSSAAFAPVPARRSSPAFRRGASLHAIAALRDDALLAWLARHPAVDADEASDGDDATGADGVSAADDGIFDEVFAGLSQAL